MCFCLHKDVSYIIESEQGISLSHRLMHVSSLNCVVLCIYLQQTLTCLAYYRIASISNKYNHYTKFLVSLLSMLTKKGRKNNKPNTISENFPNVTKLIENINNVGATMHEKNYCKHPANHE